MSKAPKSILIEQDVGPTSSLWRMTIKDEDGKQLDYTLASSRWAVWHMACMSWRHWKRQAKRGEKGEYRWH